MRCASRHGEALVLLNWRSPRIVKRQLTPDMTLLAVLEHLHRLLQRVGAIDRHFELPGVGDLGDEPQQVGVWLQDGVLESSTRHAADSALPDTPQIQCHLFGLPPCTLLAAGPDPLSHAVPLVAQAHPQAQGPRPK